MSNPRALVIQNVSTAYRAEVAGFGGAGAITEIERATTDLTTTSRQLARSLADNWLDICCCLL